MKGWCGLRDSAKLSFKDLRGRVLAGKQIVFTGFIDDADHPVLATKFVFENGVELPQLERGLITVFGAREK